MEKKKSGSKQRRKKIEEKEGAKKKEERKKRNRIVTLFGSETTLSRCQPNQWIPIKEKKKENKKKGK